MVGGRRSQREDPAGAALPGGGVPEHQVAAVVSSGQDIQEVGAGDAAARQQDSARCLLRDLAVGTPASPVKHAHGQLGAK